MEQIVGQMIRAALAAGSEIMDVYRGDFAVEHKDAGSPLTEADRRSHDTIETMLTAVMNMGLIDRIPILSEEGATIPYAERATWERYLLIDPLDGTKEFIKGNDEFTVNIALMERVTEVHVTAGTGATAGPGMTAGTGVTAGPGMTAGTGATAGPGMTAGTGVTAGPAATGAVPATDTAPVWYPVAGVVFAPALEELFVGYPKGAWWWGEIAGLVVPEVSDGVALPRVQAGGAARPWTIVASRSHMSPETAAFIAHRRRDHPDLELISAGSSLKICRVADGSADEYPRFATTMEWDTAAGDAVARAAGCEVLQWSAGSDGGVRRDGDPSRAAEESGPGSPGPRGPLVYNKEDLHNPWFLTRRAGSGRPR